MVRTGSLHASIDSGDDATSGIDMMKLAMAKSAGMSGSRIRSIALRRHISSAGNPGTPSECGTTNPAIARPSRSRRTMIGIAISSTDLWRDRNECG